MNIISCNKDTQFLDIINYPQIDIEENTFNFLIGKSGCGKSTLLKLFNKTLVPSNGCIIYNNSDIKALPALEYRKDVLLVPQQLFLTDGTIKENFQFYYNARNIPCPNSDIIKKHLKICCLNFEESTSCKNLSGGEKQRVFIAIFISFIPKVLLLDEPTSALDSNTSKELLSNLKNFCTNNSITCICVCHNNVLVDSFADNIINLGE